MTRPVRGSRLLGAWMAVAAPLALAAGEPAVQPVRVRAVAHFDFDRAVLAPQDRERLLAEVATMRNVTWQQVRTTGHTDSVGPRTHNERLAERRADAVRAYLVASGLDLAMIRVDAQADRAPVADNASAAGRAKNRRAEVEFIGVRSSAGR